MEKVQVKVVQCGRCGLATVLGPGQSVCVYCQAERQLRGRYTERLRDGFRMLQAAEREV